MDNGDAPATKRELAELRAHMDAQFDDVGARFDQIAASFGQVAARFDQMQEQMRDMQTELLKAFLPYQEESRLREVAVEGRMNAIEARQNVLSNRLGEIEKRLLINPPTL